MTLVNDSIYDLFTVNFEMHKEGWAIDELELTTPFERAIYRTLFVNDRNKRAKEASES
ncbi:baseplate hub assembly catalyst [Aeromonas phage PX29]|uniref:Uncharacterized protein n=1 Tax=Aeromonas phage PX29 TaxID=926067 RepID=E5DQB5_9CAUD|nr:baseplate hub assembly catalyst [Aeromonas phage PX29]ADQ52901.1 hypothetical protein PX29p182 [Aeromonas phage PX29]